MITAELPNVRHRVPRRRARTFRDLGKIVKVETGCALPAENFCLVGGTETLLDAEIPATPEELTVTFASRAQAG